LQKTEYLAKEATLLGIAILIPKNKIKHRKSYLLLWDEEMSKKVILSKSQLSLYRKPNRP